MKVPSNIRKTALVAAVTLAITGIPTLDNDFNLQMDLSSVVSSAYAAQGAGSGGGHRGEAMGGQQGGQREEGGQGGQHKGGKSISEVLAEEDDGDGGKPEDKGGHAGANSGKPGDTGSGKPGDAKGEDFGDIVIVEREDDGTPTGLVMIYTVNEDGETVVSRTAEYTKTRTNYSIIPVAMRKNR